MAKEETYEVEFVADGEPLVWASALTVVPAVVYPLWPDNPKLIAVGITDPAVHKSDRVVQILVPPSREVMLTLRRPGRLWFVLPRALVASATTWKPPEN